MYTLKYRRQTRTYRSISDARKGAMELLKPNKLHDVVMIYNGRIGPKALPVGAVIDRRNGHDAGFIWDRYMPTNTFGPTGLPQYRSKYYALNRDGTLGRRL